jgi:hypothetical protein
MMCVMQVLDEFELEGATKLVTSAKCIKQVLEEFSDVMPEELPHFGLSVKVKPTLPKVGTWSPPRFPKIQSSS